MNDTEVDIDMAIKYAGDCRRHGVPQMKTPVSAPKPGRPGIIVVHPEGNVFDRFLDKLDNHAALLGLLALTIMGIMLVCIRMDTVHISEKPAAQEVR